MAKWLGLVLSVSALGLATPALTQQPGPPPDSVQGRFNAAKVLLDAGKPQEALRIFEEIEAQQLASAKPSPNNLAIARVYKGDALIKLGRFEEARTSTQLALQGETLSKPALKSVAIIAREQLARIQGALLDDAAAADTFGLLKTMADSDGWRMRYGLKQAIALSVLDPERSLSAADDAITLAATLPKLEKAETASLHVARGRALLNLGRVTEARTAFAEAMKAYGALDTNVDTMEYAMRADAANAALRDGDEVTARKLMAYSGQGTTLRRSFPGGTDMTLPQCGGTEALKPDDVAVIELALSPNGTVSLARPVFGSRSGRMAYVFADALKDWRWDAANLTGISPGVLQRLRFEVRCSLSLPSTAVWDSRGNLEDWLATHPGYVRHDVSHAMKQADEAAARAETDPLKATSRWLAITRRNDVDEAESKMALDEAGKAAQRAGAPLEITVLARAVALGDLSGFRGMAAAARRSLPRILPLLDEPAIKSDAAASARVRLMLARLYALARMSAEEESILNALVKDDRLPAKHPLRTAGLVALANAAAVQGKTQVAASAFESTGLGPSQCAALSEPPMMLKRNATNKDFPEEALAWGFGGWVRQEFDIDADGKPQNIRTVVSHPPGVFNKTGARMAGDFLFRKTFRPDGSAGCSGYNYSLRFNTVK
jgi:tetratricopeptide (TPR) repeat protein